MMNLRIERRASLLLGALLGGCLGAEGLAVESAELAAPAFSAPDLVVETPTTLRAMENSGWSLAKVLGGTSDALNRLHATSTTYRDVVAVLGQDIRELAALRNAALVDYQNGPPQPTGAGSYGTGTIGGDGSYAGGLSFNPQWLEAASARFELVAVVNRLDLARTASSCGETRLLYRLSYQGAREYSRLPATISVIYQNPSGARVCRDRARAWVSQTSNDRNWQSLVRGLRATSPTRIETNLQSFRTMSATYPSGSGRFEYLLRAFSVAAKRARPILLRNTPRPDLTPEQVARLRGYLLEHKDEVDRGTLELPQEFLANRVISAQPYGFSLRSNRPFAQYFAETGSDFIATDLASTQQVRNQAAFVRRLDEMSCNGCHATRSIAGFHFVGREAIDQQSAVPMELGASNHFIESVPYRRARLTALAAGQVSDTYEPFPEHAVSAPGGYGAHCGLTQEFASWTCAAGFTCARLTEDRVGRCISNDAHFGAACIAFNMRPAVNRPTQYTSYPRAVFPADWDAQDGLTRRYLNGGATVGTGPLRKWCQANGWPDGHRQITEISAEELAASGDAFGISVPLGSSIDYCFLAGERSFAGCLLGEPEPGLPVPERTNFVIGRCDANHRCGDNYACGRVSAAEGSGACLPPYFVPSLQIMGHDVR